MTETVRGAVATKDDAAAEWGNESSPGGVLALRPDQSWWTARQAAALKALGIKNASKEDLLVFLSYCQKTELDPFSKEIYLLERRSKNKDTDRWEYTQTIQVGIDGFRARAQTAAARQGINLEYEETVWFDKDDKRHTEWLSSEPPAGALVVVVKVLSDGTRLRVPGFCRFESYAAYGHNNKTGEKWLQSQWAVMPEHMIEKCCEAFALRRAFPRDLGGLYIAEELQYSEPPPKLRSRTREPQTGDDSVVDGTVVGPESNGEAVNAAGDATAGTDLPGPEATAADPQDGKQQVPSRRESSAKILAVFREYGLGTPAYAQTRKAVVTGLLNAAQQDEAITAYANPDDLTPFALAAIAEAVATFCDGFVQGGATKEQAKDQIVKFGDAVVNTINLHDQQEAEA